MSIEPRETFDCTVLLEEPDTGFPKEGSCNFSWSNVSYLHENWEYLDTGHVRPCTTVYFRGGGVLSIKEDYRFVRAVRLSWLESKRKKPIAIFSMAFSGVKKFFSSSSVA